MVGRIVLVGMIALVSFISSDVNAQDEVADLKQRVEQLETRIQLLERALNSLLAEREKTSHKNDTPLASDETRNDEGQLDPFRAGVTWVGEVKVAGGPAVKWAISVAARDGNKFSGGMVVIGASGESFEMPISGTFEPDSGLVVIETSLVGRQRYFARGRLQNGEIAMTFRGSSRLGVDVTGAGTLRPKN